jgi:type I restriction enzyme M protein
LIDNNFVETVISLAPNLFYGTSIAVNILVLSKHKTDNKSQFIDVSGENFFKRETNNNVLTDTHIDEIVKMFDSKEDIKHVAKMVDSDEIVQNDYILSVSSYIEAKDTREIIDINELNAEIKATVKKIDKLRGEIDDIIEVIES